MFALDPLGDQIIVLQDSAEETTKGGIVIPGQAREKPQQGKVMAVGPGKRLETGEVIPTQLKAGDNVMFNTYAGTEVKVEEQTYLILSEADILARIRS